MPTVQLDGVKVVASFLTQRSYRAAYCDFLVPVTRANKAKALAQFKRAGALGKYSGLRVSGISDLAFLEEFPLLLYLEVLDQKRVDTRGLSRLSNLRGLRLESPAGGIDFGWFPKLEVFVGDWHADNRNLPAARELRQLRVWHATQQQMLLAALHGALLNVASRTGDDIAELQRANQALLTNGFPLPEISDYELRRRWGLLPTRARKRKSPGKRPERNKRRKKGP